MLFNYSSCDYINALKDYSPQMRCVSCTTHFYSNKKKKIFLSSSFCCHWLRSGYAKTTLQQARGYPRAPPTFVYVLTVASELLCSQGGRIVIDGDDNNSRVLYCWADGSMLQSGAG